MGNEKEIINDDELETVSGGNGSEIMSKDAYVLMCDNIRCRYIDGGKLLTRKEAMKVESQRKVCSKCHGGILRAHRK